MRSQTFFKILRKINFWGPNYSRCLNFWKLRLAPPCRRITLLEHRNMLYESFKYYPRGPPQATHASAWEKWEKWVPKVIRMIGFPQNFEIFPEAPGWLVWVFYDVFWCPEALGSFLEWFWIDLGSLIFSWFFSKFLVISRMLDGASTHLKTIDLSNGGVNPN